MYLTSYIILTIQMKYILRKAAKSIVSEEDSLEIRNFFEGFILCISMFCLHVKCIRACNTRGAQKASDP